ncbi:MAG TPA: hypothetical protein PKG49_08280 [Nitrosomonas mobilis]|nr:hypothetical protein [Nitrosomonas mobilis]
MSQEENSNLTAFECREIRKALHEGEWWLTDSVNIETLFRVIQSTRLKTAKKADE